MPSLPFRLPRLVWIAFALTGCAHSYYYLPEIPGNGAVQGKKGGVVYAIPPQAQPPELSLRLRSLGVHKIKKTYFLGMRMSFVRPKGAKAPAGAREFLKPEELLLEIGDGPKIKPAYVHTKAKGQGVVELTGRDREVLEILYPLRDNTGGASELVRYSFQWSLHYGAGQTETQVAQFDRYDAAPQQAGSMFPEDPDYPYDLSPIDLPGWTEVRDPMFWWPIEPWGPWW